MKGYLLFLLLLCSISALYYNMDSIRRKHRVPEMGCAVVSSKGIIALELSGYHRIDKQTAADSAKSSDYFHIGSNAKAITGFIAATLVEKGAIQWDTRFFEFYPGWLKNADPAYKNITLKDLLSHRAGIQPFTNGEKEKVPGIKGAKTEKRIAFAKYVLKQAPVKKTKQAYTYSNAGYTLAALMLEKASGKTWEELMQNTMNDRLHLNVGFGWPNLTDTSQPWGHWDEKGVLMPLPPSLNYNLSMIEPAGDIKMTMPSYAEYIQLQMLGLKGIDTVLKASTYRFLHFGLPEYVIGWANVRVREKELSQHEGSAGTFHVLTSICATDDIAYVIFCNSAGDETDRALTELLVFLERSYAKM